MVSVAEPVLRDLFEDVRIYTFTNPLTFPSWNWLLEYWRATELYSSAIEPKIVEEFKSLFAGQLSFTITKHVMGILAENMGRLANPFRPLVVLPASNWLTWGRLFHAHVKPLRENKDFQPTSISVIPTTRTLRHHGGRFRETLA